MLTPGTGFTIVPGAMSKIQDGGLGQRLEVPFNLSADPFIPDGTRINPDGEAANNLKLARYFGGDSAKWNWFAQGDWTETSWRPPHVLRGFLRAWKAGHDVNRWDPKVFQMSGNPTDYANDAWPTHREETDYKHAFTRDESAKWYERLSAMGFIEGASKPAEDIDRPGKPTKQPPNTVPPSVPTHVPPNAPPVVPPGVPSPVNPIPLLEQLISKVNTMATSLDAYKTTLDEIKDGQGRSLDRLANLRDETARQGTQLDVLVRRSKPQGGSTGGGGAKGEVKRKNKPA